MRYHTPGRQPQPPLTISLVRAGTPLGNGEVEIRVNYLTPNARRSRHPRIRGRQEPRALHPDVSRAVAIRRYRAIESTHYFSRRIQPALKEEFAAYCSCVAGRGRM